MGHTRQAVNTTLKSRFMTDLWKCRDNGIGMSADDLRNFFWTIGASGKRNAEAKAAGCVGTFGIGGFANFGVCSTLEVISQTARAGYGTLTRLSEAGHQICRQFNSVSDRRSLGRCSTPGNIGARTSKGSAECR